MPTLLANKNLLNGWHMCMVGKHSGRLCAIPAMQNSPLSELALSSNDFWYTANGLQLPHTTCRLCSTPQRQPMLCSMHSVQLGGAGCFSCRAQFAEVLSKTPWASKTNQYFHTREEEYVHGLRCALGIWCVLDLPQEAASVIARLAFAAECTKPTAYVLAKVAQ